MIVVQQRSESDCNQANCILTVANEDRQDVAGLPQLSSSQGASFTFLVLFGLPHEPSLAAESRAPRAKGCVMVIESGSSWEVSVGATGTSLDEE
jgi:hypothetical protein